MRLTAEQIQNCKKIMHEEIGQNDFCDRLFDLVTSKDLADDVWNDPEIVAFLQTKNINPNDINVGFTLRPIKKMSPEEAFRFCFRLDEMDRLTI